MISKRRVSIAAATSLITVPLLNRILEITKSGEAMVFLISRDGATTQRVIRYGLYVVSLCLYVSCSSQLIGHSVCDA